MPPLFRGAPGGGAGVKQLLLDGQQRLTSLYGVIRGRAPDFFEGDARAFTDMRFNVRDEIFEVYAPMRMRDDPLWVDVSDLFRHGLDMHMARLQHLFPEQLVTYLRRLNKLYEIMNRGFHTEIITGTDKTVEVVVDIFNRVNSGGTKLSKGDLALAKICARWPDARAELRSALAKWKDGGYEFSLEWLLRNVTAVATGRALFSALDEISTAAFRDALAGTLRYIGRTLDTIAGRLGLDHDRVLMGRYALPVISRYLHLNGGTFPSAAERDRMLYWYTHAALWGRFSGSTETVLAQDFETVARDGVPGLIETLARSRGGSLEVAPHEFEGFSLGSRVYPILYLLTRVGGALDLGLGDPLNAHLLGHLSRLQVHHIFPKALLYERGYGRGEVNAVANFCLLTQDTNLEIGKRYPEEYLAEVESNHPGVLASQWIPEDPTLWHIDRYRDFLAVRREMLATAANAFLGQLASGTAAPAEDVPRVVMVSEEEPDEPEEVVRELARELEEAGYAAPLLNVEVVDPDRGSVLTVAEAYWPEGLQSGQGAPVVLELDPAEADLARLEELGYEIFTSVQALRHAVARRGEMAAGLLAAG